MAFEVLYSGDGFKERCARCHRTDEEPALQLYESNGRGRNNDRNLIFVHVRCLERACVAARARHIRETTKETAAPAVTI